MIKKHILLCIKYTHHPFTCVLTSVCSTLMYLHFICTYIHTYILADSSACNKSKNNYECLHRQPSAKCTRETAASNAESIVALNRPQPTSTTRIRTPWQLYEPLVQACNFAICTNSAASALQTRTEIDDCIRIHIRIRIRICIL